MGKTDKMLKNETTKKRWDFMVISVMMTPASPDWVSLVCAFYVACQWPWVRQHLEADRALRALAVQRLIWTNVHFQWIHRFECLWGGNNKIKLKGKAWCHNRRVVNPARIYWIGHSAVPLTTYRSWIDLHNFRTLHHIFTKQNAVCNELPKECRWIPPVCL